jgi:hypothetical protein
VYGALDFAHASWRQGTQPLDQESAGDSGDGVEVHNAWTQKAVLLVEMDLRIESSHGCRDLGDGDLVSEVKCCIP